MKSRSNIKECMLRNAYELVKVNNNLLRVVIEWVKKNETDQMSAEDIIFLTELAVKISQISDDQFKMVQRMC